MAVTITFSGQIDDVLFELRQLAANHEPAAAPQEPLTGFVAAPPPGGMFVPLWAASGAAGDPPDPAVIAAGNAELAAHAAATAAHRPVEQRVAEAIAALPKRSRRTKAEMEAARATEAKLAEPVEAPGSEAGIPASVEVDAVEKRGADDYAVEKRGADDYVVERVEQVAGAFHEARDDETDPAPAPTFDDLKRALSTVLETDGLGVESGRALVASFGAKKLPDLNAVEWPLFISKANALVRLWEDFR